MPITTIPDLTTEFEGPKVLKPGLSAIPFADRFHAWRTAMANAVLNRVIEAFSLIAELPVKYPARAASTGNINLAAPGASIDGVTMVLNDRFLAKDQSAPAQNGIYIWNGAAVAATRSTDTNTAARIQGMSVNVRDGALNAGLGFVLVTSGAITLGTTALAYRRDQPSAGGVWTPTLTAVVNLDSVTLQSAQYVHVDGIVFGTVRAQIDPTASGLIDFRISLPPVAPSNFTSTAQAIGVGASFNLGSAGIVDSVIATDDLRVRMPNTVTTAYDVVVTFSYQAGLP